MKKIKQLGLGLLLGVSLSACGTGADAEAEETGVAVTQINYTDKPIIHVGIAKLKDPNVVPFKEAVRKRVLPIDDNPAETDLPFIDRDSALLILESYPYSQGGVQCCLDLPEKWQPNMRYLVRVKPDIESDTEEEWVKEGNTYYDYIVEIPKYTPEQRSTLYVLVLPEHKIEVVVSNVGPTHENWNGQTKGAPVPSYEYALAQWEKEDKRLRNYAYPAPRYSNQHYEEYWKSDARFEPEKIAGFNDSKDPAYRVFTDNDSFEHRWNTIMYGDKEKLKGFKSSQDPAFRRYIEQKEDEMNQRWKEHLDDWQQSKPKKSSAQEQKS